MGSGARFAWICEARNDRLRIDCARSMTRERSSDLHEFLAPIRAVAATLFDPDGTRWDIGDLEGSERLTISAAHRHNLFLVVTEALTNVRRHARASVVTVRVTTRGERIRIEVVDDGVGMSTEGYAALTGNGLRNMERRAADLRGTLLIESRPKWAGTRVVIHAPLH